MQGANQSLAHSKWSKNISFHCHVLGKIEVESVFVSLISTAERKDGVLQKRGMDVNQVPLSLMKRNAAGYQRTLRQAWETELRKPQ